MKLRSQIGFTLVELAIVVALIAILAALALPSFNGFIANSRVRTAAEGVMNGLQIARAEAVRRNSFVDFKIGPDNIAWEVVTPALPPPDDVLQRRNAEPNPAVTATVAALDEFYAEMPLGPNVKTVTYAGFGRVVSMWDAAGVRIPSDSSAPPPTILAIRYRSPVSGSRDMCVVVIANTPKLCDPARSGDLTDPQACYYVANNGDRVAIPTCL